MREGFVVGLVFCSVWWSFLHLNTITVLVLTQAEVTQIVPLIPNAVQRGLIAPYLLATG